MTVTSTTTLTTLAVTVTITGLLVDSWLPVCFALCMQVHHSVGSPLQSGEPSLCSVDRQLSTPPPLSLLLALLLFKRMKRGPAAMSLLPGKQFFAGARAIFIVAFFSNLLNDTVCRAGAWAGAWVGCERFFTACGGAERTLGHQQVKESEAKGYIVLLQTSGTPYKPLGPSPAGNPTCFGFVKELVQENLNIGHRVQNH